MPPFDPLHTIMGLKLGSVSHLVTKEMYDNQAAIVSGLGSILVGFNLHAHGTQHIPSVEEVPSMLRLKSKVLDIYGVFINHRVGLFFSVLLGIVLFST